MANGAQVIDVNMDEGLLDSEKAMVEFLNLVASEPDISRVPIMVDSSKFHVIEAGLKTIQGKPVVNSISMKEGVEAFIEQARICRMYGAAVVVMAFDEKGQARHLRAQGRDLRRAYDILVNQVGFPPEDIIFDPNIFAVATGIEEHDDYGNAFIDATRTIRETLPHAHVSGGVSNLSFSFRGNEPVRERCTRCSCSTPSTPAWTWGSSNAGQLGNYDKLDPELKELCEDVVLNRRPDSTERLLEGRSPLQGRRRPCRERQGPRLARRPRREAAGARAGQRHHRVSSRPTPRRRAPPQSARCTSSRGR